MEEEGEDDEMISWNDTEEFWDFLFSKIVRACRYIFDKGHPYLDRLEYWRDNILPVATAAFSLPLVVKEPKVLTAVKVEPNRVYFLNLAGPDICIHLPMPRSEHRPYFLETRTQREVARKGSHLEAYKYWRITVDSF